MLTATKENEIYDSMTEAELYVKYQCYSQARELLEEIIGQYPKYLPAKEALADIYRKRGNIEKANEIARDIALISEQVARERQSGGEENLEQFQKRHLLERMDSIIKEIYNSNHLPEILRTSATRLVEGLCADRCVIITLGPDKGSAKSYEYCCEGAFSSQDHKTAKLNLLLLKRVSGGVDPLVIDETMKDLRLADLRPVLEEFKIQSLMAYPLVYKSNLIGLAIVHRCTRPVSWSEQEVTLFSTVVEHIAVAIGNARQLSTIQTMAITDKLTGLYNRPFFEERLSAELRNAQQQAYPISVAMIDIDHFKRINDTQGHAAGDRALHKLGFVLKTHLRRGTVVARFGGEEFVVILPNTVLKTAHQIMDKIRELVEQTLVSDSGSPITISVGVAEVHFREQGTLASTQEELVHEADMNLYDAKRSGRNNVCSDSSSAKQR